MAQLVSLEHDAGHVVLLPLHTSGKHDGLPVPPLPSVVQVPSALAPRATVQTAQEPAQVDEQHTLSEQALVRHWLFVVQAVPFEKRATHTLPLQ